MSLPERFEIRRERTGRVHRLIPTGGLDIATTPILEQAFEDVDHDDASTAATAHQDEPRLNAATHDRWPRDVSASIRTLNRSRRSGSNRQ